MSNEIDFITGLFDNYVRRRGKRYGCESSKVMEIVFLN